MTIEAAVVSREKQDPSKVQTDLENHLASNWSDYVPGSVTVQSIEDEGLIANIIQTIMAGTTSATDPTNLMTEDTKTLSTETTESGEGKIERESTTGGAESANEVTVITKESALFTTTAPDSSAEDTTGSPEGPPTIHPTDESSTSPTDSREKQTDTQEGKIDPLGTPKGPASTTKGASVEVTAKSDSQEYTSSSDELISLVVNQPTTDSLHPTSTKGPTTREDLTTGPNTTPTTQESLGE